MGNDELRHPAGKLLRKLYVSDDGVMVVGNVWICKSAMGLPMDVIFETLKKENCIPHFPEFIAQAMKEGMNPNKFESEFRTAFIDVYGRNNWIRLNEWLKVYYESTRTG